jgi:hypothetical protein
MFRDLTTRPLCRGYGPGLPDSLLEHASVLGQTCLRQPDGFRLAAAGAADHTRLIQPVHRRILSVVRPGPFATMQRLIRHHPVDES